jgi:hypothetical protein
VFQLVPSRVDIPQMNSNPPNHRRLAGQLSLLALSIACVVTPAPAGAASAPQVDGHLSARLDELARPAVRSAPPAEQAASLSLAASGPGSLLRDGKRPLVEIRFRDSAAAALEELRAAGAELVHFSRRYETVTAAVRAADLRRVSRLPGVDVVTEVLRPLLRGADCGGAVRSEGDGQLNAANARNAFGVDGSGVTVGILSDSFDRDPAAATHAAGDVASGDLPGPGSPCGSATPVSVFDDSEGEGIDEGRAMAQIVHDLAPGAAIDFATAFTGEAAFAANVHGLAAAGAKVIADDVVYFEEPFFQDGPVANAVNEVAAAGVSFFSAAGNDNLIDAGGRNIASWEAPAFRDANECPPFLAAIAGFGAGHCMDFDPVAGPANVDDTFGITVAKDETLTVDLQWAEPWNGVDTDLDAYLLDASGKPLKVKIGAAEAFVASRDDNLETERPVELLQWENHSGGAAEVRLAINDCIGTCNPFAATATAPRLKFALLENGHGVSATEYPQSASGDVVGPTVFGHSGAEGAISTGAIRYDAGVAPESYSSRGPVKHYFGPVTGPGPAAATGERVISKPDVVATDCGVTTFFYRPDPSRQPPYRFCGTSAAAPHAAAVAALVRQANPGAGAAQIRATLAATAHPVGAFGPDAVGAGLLDAYGAVQALALPPTITITKAPEPLSRNRRPTIEFTANRPVGFSCEVDGGAPQPCSSPYGLPQALADGRHGIAVSGIDAAGRRGSAAASFEIDTRRPRTRIVKHPPKVVRTHRRTARVAFRFASSEPGSTFVCKVDRGPLRFCARRIQRRLGEGQHVIKVRARDRAGNVDATPAVFRFRVKRVG